MNNDDICIHCELTKEEHEQNTPWCHDFKSISQHYAELRGPENLRTIEILAGFLKATMHNTPHTKKKLLGDIDAAIEVLSQAIEASKPPK